MGTSGKLLLWIAVSGAASCAREKVMAIRSPGRDGKFSYGPYRTGNFTSEDYDEDIVWVIGYFVRWPEGLNTRR
jgi:hypothetical protein